jgi:hypothetical protein
MDPENPTIQNSLTDLEIKCSDDISIYVGRNELARKTSYFKSLLLGNFKEATSNVISLSYNSVVLTTLFRYVLYGFDGDDYKKKQLNNLVGRDINDFFYACHEYQFNSIIKEADKYFSSDEKIKICFNAEMLNAIHLLNLNKMKHKINEWSMNKEIKDLNFESINCATLSVFTIWGDFLLALDLWLDKHKTNDEELEKSKIFDDSYKNLADSSMRQYAEIMEKKMKTYPNTVNKIKAAIFDAKININNELQLSNKPNDFNEVDFIINNTKQNYIRLNGCNSKEILKKIRKCLYIKDIWDENDKITTCKSSNIYPSETHNYENISNAMKFI